VHPLSLTREQKGKLGYRNGSPLMRVPLIDASPQMLHPARLSYVSQNDPDHGARGAALLHQLMEQELLFLSDEISRLLRSACRLHADGLTARQPTVGACWDADRLNLLRVGMTADALHVHCRG
jgi:hypothetical protein